MSLPGFGDEATWGAYTGHPLDPRFDDEGLEPCDACGDLHDHEDLQECDGALLCTPCAKEHDQ